MQPEGVTPEVPDVVEPEVPVEPENPGSGSDGTTTTQSPPPIGGDICTRSGYVRDPQDCSVFYQCVEHAGTYIEYRFICPTGLYFDPSIIACNYPSLVSC